MQRTGALLWGIMLTPSLRPLNVSISRGLLVDLLTCRLGLHVPAVVVLAAHSGCEAHAAGHLARGSPAQLSCSGLLSSSPHALLPFSPTFAFVPTLPWSSSSVRIQDASRSLVGGPFVFSTCF